MERLQSRAAQQRETITQLEVENANVQRLKVSITLCSTNDLRAVHIHAYTIAYDLQYTYMHTP